MAPRLHVAAVLGLVAASLGSLAFGLGACASPPESERLTTVIQPDFPTYATYVDPYLNRRCGTLDCHGQAGRAYRIYSREGFRLYTINDGGLVSGREPTQPEETRANYHAILGLEPEEMNRAMARQGARDAIQKLVFLRKPLRLERHKGGQSMAEDDPGYRCVEAWLQIPVVRGDGTPIPQAERQGLSPNALRACAEAQAVP